MAGEPIERLSARVSAEAKQNWLDFCEAQGVTFTAMVEASGLLLAEHGEHLKNESVITLARKIDAERFKRR